MTEVTVRKFEMLVRVVGFFVSNPIDFRKGSRGLQFVEKFKRAVNELRNLTVQQMTDIAQARANSGDRGNARNALVGAMKKISGCARGMAIDTPGFDDKFRMPWHAGDTVILARAHSFAENATPYLKDFVNFEMAPTFVDDLIMKIKTFEQAFNAHTASKAAHVATSQQIGVAMQTAMTILTQLDPIVANKLDGDFVPMHKWKNVRHIERAWVSKKPVLQPEPAPEPTPGPIPIVRAA
jgi:ribosomal protein L11